jgi:CheY-like chemotaxis protein
MRPGRPVEILLVDGNAGDVRLTGECLQKGRAAPSLHVMDNGDDALSFLRREGKYAGVPATDLVLLELGLRGLDGGALLAEIKRDPALARIPVIVLTASESNEAARRAYALHANCFITKPPDPARFAAAIASLQNFWLEHAILPPST